ncbi:Hachiman antiphage defense system protein HamA, partial [Enterococcus entomosocium]
LTCNDHFISKNIGELLNKIKLRYFCWEEIISSKVTLFQKLNDILFDQTIVLDIASSYNPSIHKYEERLLKKKYYSALQSIGFISKHELDTDLSVLHGDIGEFLMHHLVSNYISDNNSVKYLYPKLVLKSNPKMPAYGNDGTIYVPSKKEIFYLEAKFYTNLTKAINKAVDSLKEHNEVTQENIDHKTELFRNIKTKSNDEIIEITDDVNEKLVLFLICDNIFKEEDVLKCLKKNNGLIELKKSFEVIIF